MGGRGSQRAWVCFLGFWKCSNVRLGDSYVTLCMYWNHSTVYFKRVNLWYMNYISMKLFWKMYRGWFNNGPMPSFNHYQLVTNLFSSIPRCCHPATTLTLAYFQKQTPDIISSSNSQCVFNNTQLYLFKRKRLFFKKKYGTIITSKKFKIIS